MLGWFFTIFGPVLAGISAWVPTAGIVRAVRIGAWVVSLAVMSLASIAAANWWHSGKLTVAQADQRCADTISVATLRAQERALVAQQYALREREERVTGDEERLRAEITRMERDRAETTRAGDDGVLLPADDEWLQRWRGQHSAAGRRR